MLLAFGGRNIFSFKEGFFVNLQLDKNCPNTISNKKTFANLLAIKGANASGKTNVLKTLTFIIYFSKHSFNLEPNEEIPFINYFNSEEDTNLFIEFLNDKIKYKYEIQLNKKEIKNETFYINNKIAFERNDNNLIIKNPTFDDLKTIKLRKNASIISTAHQYTFESITPIYELFGNNISNVTLNGLKPDLISYNDVSKLYKENKEYLKFTKKILSKVDTGIDDIIIEEIEDPETEKKKYIPFFVFNINGKKELLSYDEQSSGTKALFKQLGAYKAVLDTGGLLILDEFDTNLHPDLLPILVEFFDSPKLNKNNAQLVFSTHHIEIMDKLKKYRVILVNKEENESYLYRLDEINGDILRNDRSISKIYNTGKLGGRPRIKDFNE